MDEVVGHLFEETCPAVIITDNGFFVVELTTGPPGHKMAQNNRVTSTSCYQVVIKFRFVELKYPTTMNYLFIIDVPANPLYRAVAYCQGI